ILVNFRSDAAASAVLAGTTLSEPIALVPGLRPVGLAAGVGVEAALSAYQASPLVRYAEPNYLVWAADRIPDDPRFRQLGALRNTGQTGAPPGAVIHAPAAWDVTTGSRNVRVADIDTGIAYDHPDLAPNMAANRGYNFVNNTPDPRDDNGHGTHTAGTI